MVNPPHFKGFKPIGNMQDSHPVIINFEEYEAIRLCDYELRSQFDASVIMEVSRPTFTRIYESARRKVAQALVHGKTIIFEGGKVYFDSEWYVCAKCNCWFNHPEKDLLAKKCALCGSTEISQNAPDSLSSDLTPCICPNCKKEFSHTPGIPCSHEKCPECSCIIERKSLPSQQITYSRKCK